MKDGDKKELFIPGSAPLLQLARAMESRRESTCISTRSQSKVNVFLEPFVMNFVAPDHLITELAKYVVQCTFAMIHSRKVKEKLDWAICLALKEVGIYGQISVFNNVSGNSHIWSMSTV